MSGVETYVNSEFVVDIAPVYAWCFTQNDDGMWCTVVLDGDVVSDPAPWHVMMQDVAFDCSTTELVEGVHDQDEFADSGAFAAMFEAVSWKVRTLLVGILITTLCRAGRSWVPITLTLDAEPFEIMGHVEQRNVYAELHATTAQLETARSVIKRVLGDGPAHLIDGTTTVTDHEGYREIDLSPGQCLLVREIVG
jgi:hypothetical protein